MDPSHLTLRSWKRDRAAILKRLQLDRAPKIVWLIDGQAEVSSSKGLPIVESLRERSFEGITFPSDAKIPVASAELPLSASDVKGVRMNRKRLATVRARLGSSSIGMRKGGNPSIRSLLGLKTRSELDWW